MYTDGIHSIKYATDKQLSDELVNRYSNQVESALSSSTTIDWFGNIDNMRWVRAVMNYYERGIPETHKVINFYFFYDKQDAYWFLWAAQFFKKYNFPFIAATPDKCTLINDVVKTVDSHKESVLQTETDWVLNKLLGILNDIRNELTLRYNTMACSTILTQQQQQQQLNILESVTDKAIQQEEGKKDYSQYAVYAIVAIIVIVVFIKIIKR